MIEYDVISRTSRAVVDIIFADCGNCAIRKFLNAGYVFRTHRLSCNMNILDGDVNKFDLVCGVLHVKRSD